MSTRALSAERRFGHAEVVTTQTTGRADRRPAATGFAVGFAMAFVATFLALALPFFERLHAVLVPASVLLRPISAPMADWNGLVNMLLAGVVNGAIYAAVFVLAAALLRGRRADRQR